MRSRNMPDGRAWSLAAMILAAASFAVALSSQAHADDAGGSDRGTVKVIADQRLTVTTVDGAGLLALYVSADWTRPLPDIAKAVVVFHGRLRNADDYYRSAMSAIEAAGEAGRGTLLIARGWAARALWALRGSAHSMRSTRSSRGLPIDPTSPTSSRSSSPAIPEAVSSRSATRSLPRIRQRCDRAALRSAT